MKSKTIVFISILISIPLTSCNRNSVLDTNIDNKAYITDFELIQQNPRNNTKIKINSPKAILDSSTQNIEIINSQIEILGEYQKNIKIKSGKALLNNTRNHISAKDNIVITDNKQTDNSIKTDQLSWELNKSIINLDKELIINFANTNIYSKEGIYDLNLNKLDLKNVFFTRKIKNRKGFTSYDIIINADNSKWLKENNSLEFSSDNGQVETTIDIFNY